MNLLRGWVITIDLHPFHVNKDGKRLVIQLWHPSKSGKMFSV